MASLRRIEANRRNAQKSTGPRTDDGKSRARCNAIRHGLTAETVLELLEDTEDYKAFEASVTADFDAQTAVERELVLRLVSLLWRLRRAIAIETGLSICTPTLRPRKIYHRCNAAKVSFDSVRNRMTIELIGIGIQMAAPNPCGHLTKAI